MFKPLDRPIAIVVADSEVNSATAAGGKFLSELINEFEAQSTLFSASNFSLIDVSKFEAILLAEVEIDASRLLREFHSQSKPIAAIGQSVKLVAKTFAAEGVEITTGEDASLGIQITAGGALHTLCPANDYVSDRDNKTLTTPGSFQRDLKASAEGVRRMVKELVEMA
jgi:enhancing lycopene biosynthesis protein 2